MNVGRVVRQRFYLYYSSRKNERLEVGRKSMRFCGWDHSKYCINVVVILKSRQVGKSNYYRRDRKNLVCNLSSRKREIWIAKKYVQQFNIRARVSRTTLSDDYEVIKIARKNRFFLNLRGVLAFTIQFPHKWNLWIRNFNEICTYEISKLQPRYLVSCR